MSANGEGQRHKQREMRLIAKRAEAKPGENRPSVNKQGRRAEQSSGQERVLPEPKIPPHHRKSEEGDERGPAVIVEDATGDGKKKQERRRLERDERDEIGQVRY